MFRKSSDLAQDQIGICRPNKRLPTFLADAVSQLHKTFSECHQYVTAAKALPAGVEVTV